MFRQGFIFYVIICATYSIGTSARHHHHRQRRSLDTTFVDIARETLTSLAIEKGIKLNDKFYLAIHEIEIALSKIQSQKGALTIKQDTDGSLKQEFMKNLERAAKSGSVESFREVLGRALFYNISALSTNVKEQKLHPNDETKALLDGAKAFLTGIKQKIGKELFEELISINGEVTLVFVIDSTGSMKEDIEAAKAIANEIISHKREVPVNFILSTFNDPDVAPIVYHDEQNLAHATLAIGNITVNGGDDCPEMAFEGLIQALYYGPMPGSAMYVFTDAYAKDDTRDNIETVTALAIDLGVSIYFFTSGDCGGHTAEMQSFKTVAQATGGLSFPLHSSNEIIKLSKFVKQNLEGGATVDSNTVNERKTKTYSIMVDDTIKTLVLTVIMSKTGITVRLKSPDGVEKNATNRMDMNVIFTIENPAPGNWTLEVPSSAGDVEYLVRTISRLNIDFDHYYFKYLPRISSRGHIPVAHPLLGEDANVMVTIHEMQHVDNTSLHLNIIYKNGTTSGTFNMSAVGTSRSRFISQIQVDEGPYKLQLVGRTKQGHMFTRLTSVYDEAKPFRLRIYYAGRYTLPVGERSRLMLVIDNPSAENYVFEVKDSFGYALHVESKGGSQTDIKRTWQPRRRNFDLMFQVPANATANINKTNRVIIQATGNKTGIVSTEIAHLLVTPMKLN